MDKMKIVLLTKYPLGELSDGPAVHRAGLIYYISQRSDIELHIVTFGDENNDFKKNNLNLHVVKRTKAFYILFFAPIALWIIRSKIRKIKPDIVHALGTFPPWSTVATLVRNKYPTIVTLYGIASKELIGYMPGISCFLSLFSIQYQKYIFSKNPYIVVESSSIKKLIRNMTKSKIYIVPDGIEFEKIQAIQPQLSKNSRILFVGRLLKLKGVDLLIKAIPRVIEAIPDLSVNIVGTGSQENEIKNLVKELKLEEYVEFSGFISEEEKFQCYMGCEVVVVPSRWDCSPITIYEAMSCGKPVVASNVTNSEILKIGKTGFLFESENVEDLAEKMVILLKDEELREKMGKEAKEKAKQYDWSKIAERTVKIYK
jgi:glycosyltransferase involved in cell wall biosynthesis